MGGTAGLFVVLDGIVDDQEMGAAAGDRAAHPGRRHAAVPAFQIPAMDGGGALGDLHAERRSPLL